MEDISPPRVLRQWPAHTCARIQTIYRKAGLGGGLGGPIAVQRTRRRSKPTRSNIPNTSTTASNPGITPTGNGDDCSGNSPDVPSAPSASAAGIAHGK